MTQQRIKEKVSRLYFDIVKESINFEEDDVDLAKKKAIDAIVKTEKYVWELEDTLGVTISYSTILLPHIKKIIAQPSLEKIEYILDAIDFSLNFDK